MELNEFYEQLLTSSNFKNQQKLLHDAFPNLEQQHIDELAERLKEQVVQLLFSNTQDAVKLSDLILYLAELSKNILHRALGLRAKAQAVMLGMGEFQQALDLYDEAIEIYHPLGDRLGIARVNVTRIWALANLGLYTQAVEEAENAILVLKEHSQWRSLATLLNNLATIHNRTGKYKLALDMHTKARDAYIQIGKEGEQYLATSELNRALDFYVLAQYDNSIRASNKALALAKRFDQSTVIARANHNMGFTYYRLGRNNQALYLFEQARETHLANNQVHEAALCDLSSMYCLNELRKFDDILRICQEIIPLFIDKGMRLEAADATRFQALAFSKLGRYQDAIDALHKARCLFIEERNKHWVSLTDLETAALLNNLGDFSGGLNAAQKCIIYFEKHDLIVDAALAKLVAARSAFGLGQSDLAYNLCREALETTEIREIPFLMYQNNKLLGQIAQAKGDIPSALSYYEDSIAALEKLRGNVMTEFQAEFFEDKQSVYDAIVDLFLRSDQPGKGLAYAERAKSRALLKILAFRPEVDIHARDKQDEPLVAEIANLRNEREQLLRFNNSHMFELKTEDRQKEVLSIEQRITALWHKLLVRNTAYVNQASLWQVQIEEVQPFLEDGVLLLDYYLIADELTVFLISSEGEIRDQRLSATRTQVERYLQLLKLNLSGVPRSATNRVADLTANAQVLLGNLYQSLLEPISSSLTEYERLIVVPHGPLHYLPFHALYDGKSYLIEKYPLSYLPGASFLRFYREVPTANSGVLAIGHSNGGQILNAPLEAANIAKIFQTQAYIEEDAAFEHLKTLMSEKQILHLACHGEFYADNPLFSGLSLADGWLTTLDVFNLQLNASLVTLSACETGRSVVGGGDELLGIMRAFLAAGAASLLISHWAVEDRSTLILMEIFYQNLKKGRTKAEALQIAQKLFLRQKFEMDFLDQDQMHRYMHPFYWAPFFLTGASGEL